ncbi:uncharacterized protein EV420DRAFT_1750982 [Desarmillaria tabescens]|uniref:DUF6697 domain-containing protein n=1 Tax=Armillaria tabescens TaxID=1929756 RepID=A0AA39JSW4_ARMTA|nr:uncharacterized protein EV420DRAFT_1750982 [Desarmillaria tabescens]KAK0448326.1 hypothetical protein EV420DRAFT_1750982 [Desarmillaria tabescens]
MTGSSTFGVVVKIEDGLEETGVQFQPVSNEPNNASIKDDGGGLLVPQEDKSRVEVRLPKRRRMLVPSVVIPTLPLALRLAKHEDYKKLKKMINPKVKKKKGVVRLSEDSIRARLNPIGLDLFPIPLPPTTSNVGFPRDFISTHYGGNTQSTFPSIGKHFIDLHGDIDYMYLNLCYNPHAPQVPGAPGLFYGWSGDSTMTFRIISRTESSEWTYVGEYKTGPCAPLTVQEWNSQERVVKMTWAQGILTKKWGVDTRAKIRLRERLRREPTEEEIDDAIDAGEKFQDVTIEEVLDEYSSGRKILHISTLKCFEYDAGFQRFLVDKFPSYVPKPRATKGSKKQADTGPTTPSRAKKSSNTKNDIVVKTGEKRKRRDRRRAHDDDEDEDEVEEFEELVYRPRGTRSRPGHGPPKGNNLNSE